MAQALLPKSQKAAADRILCFGSLHTEQAVGYLIGTLESMLRT